MNEFKCNVCRRHFPTQRSLTSHEARSHTHLERGTKYKCQYCEHGSNDWNSMQIHIRKHPEAGAGGTFKRNLRSRSKSLQCAPINNNTINTKNNNKTVVSAADGTRSSANQISVAGQSSRERELERIRGLRQSQRSSSRSQPLQREMNKNTVPPATMGTSTTQSIHPTMTTTAKTTTTANDNNANAIQTNGKPRSPPRDPRPSRIQYSSSRISPEPVSNSGTNNPHKHEIMTLDGAPQQHPQQPQLPPSQSQPANESAGDLVRGNAVEGDNPTQMNGTSTNRRKRGLGNDVDEAVGSTRQAHEAATSSNDEDNTADGDAIQNAEGHSAAAEEEWHDGGKSPLDIEIKRANLELVKCQIVESKLHAEWLRHKLKRNK